VTFPQSVALRQLEVAGDLVPTSQQAELADACTVAHEAVSVATERYMKEMRRHVYITPKSYLDLLNTYTSLLSAKRHELVSSRQRFVTGVAKLEDTKAMVASLQVMLVSLGCLVSSQN
jgi:dynein heavy chain, axonemal